MEYGRGGSISAHNGGDVFGRPGYEAFPTHAKQAYAVSTKMCIRFSFSLQTLIAATRGAPSQNLVAIRGSNSKLGGVCD